MVTDHKAQGRKNRAAGARFELKFRKIMEEKGWIVDKWGNNIDLQTNEIVKAKSNRFRMSSTGFPDFVLFKKMTESFEDAPGYYDLRLVECKLDGYLTKMEKEKLKVYQDKGFQVFIAYKDETQENKLRMREYVHGEDKEKIPRGL